jgi:hypothetical protein
MDVRHWLLAEYRLVDVGRVHAIVFVLGVELCLRGLWVGVAEDDLGCVCGKELGLGSAVTVAVSVDVGGRALYCGGG